MFLLAALSRTPDTIFKISFAFAVFFSDKANSNFLIAVFILDFTTLFTKRLFTFFRASFKTDVCLPVFNFIIYRF